MEEINKYSRFDEHHATCVSVEMGHAYTHKPTFFCVRGKQAE